MVFRERRGKKAVSRNSQDAQTIKKINRQLLTQEGNRHREGAMGDDEKKERERKERRKDLRR
jgi:hypothetical protein